MESQQPWADLLMKLFPAITDLKDIFTVYKAKSRVCGL